MQQLCEGLTLFRWHTHLLDWEPPLPPRTHTHIPSPPLPFIRYKQMWRIWFFTVSELCFNAVESEGFHRAVTVPWFSVAQDSFSLCCWRIKYNRASFHHPLPLSSSLRSRCPLPFLSSAGGEGSGTRGSRADAGGRGPASASYVLVEIPPIWGLLQVKSQDALSSQWAV